MSFLSARRSSLHRGWRGYRNAIALPHILSGAWLPGLGSLILLLLMWGLGGSRALEPYLQGLLLKSRGEQAWDQRLVLIKIDQASLESLGWFPWRRDRYSELLEILTRAGTNTVVLDLIFSEETPEDETLAAAIVNHGQVVLASAWYANRQPWLPNPRLKEAAIATGHIAKLLSSQLTAGLDSITTLPNIEGHSALAIVAAQVHQLLDPTLQTLQWPKGDTPIIPNWPAPVEQLEQYSFAEVLSQRIPLTAFQDKIILVGVTAEGMDPLRTPFDQDWPSSGVHLHAAILHSLFQQNLLHRPPQWMWLPWLVGWLLVCRYGLSRFSIQRQGQLLGLGAIAWIVISITALQMNRLLPLVLPLCLFGGTGLIALLSHSKQLAESNRQLREKAAVDITTKIKNRLFFNEYSAFVWRQMIREERPLSLILCDVDHFKLYNDAYGHLQGDQCLYQVAQALQASIHRASDLVARYGGEEFIILLPATNLARAEGVAKDIQEQLLEERLLHSSSPISDQVTLSLGIACIQPSTEVTLELLIDRADRALYRAKQQGRNRYCTA